MQISRETAMKWFVPESPTSTALAVLPVKHVMALKLGKAMKVIKNRVKQSKVT